jgi:hypothetical protein
MAKRAHQHRIVLLTTRFRHPERRLLFTRARLFPDRIDLHGWSFGDTYDQVIYLDHVRRIDWPDLEAEQPYVLFHLDDGSTCSLHLQAADLWRYTLEQRLAWSPAGPHRLPRLGNLPMEELISYTSSMS